MLIWVNYEVKIQRKEIMNKLKIGQKKIKIKSIENLTN